MIIKNHTKENLEDISKIIPNPRNPNQHDKNQLTLLSKIIKFQGWRLPIVVSNLSGFIVRGHGRLEVAKLLGQEKIPVSYQDYETEAQEWSDLIADNRIAELAEIERSTLKDLLEELDTGELDMELTGFDEKSLGDLMSEFFEPEDGLTDDDEIPEEVEARCKLGDLWELGQHRLMCGDCTDFDSVSNLMDNEKAYMIFTDPPYNADYSSRVDKKRRKPWGGIINDNMSSEAFDTFLIDINSLYWSYLVDGGSIYECIDWKHYSQMEKVFKQAFNQKAMIVWNKNYFGLGTYYRTKHEIILFGVKGDKVNTWNASHNEMDVWDIDREKVKNYQHPTQKPVSIPERAVANSSKKGDIIADFFLGSGSTLIACEKLKRKCYGMELDPNYCDVIIQRWEDFTSKKAILLNE